jgi:poly(3-hydroxybutyrate) depolymerase
MIAAFGPTRRTRRPALGLDVTTCDGRDVPVSEEILLERSFCRLLRFRRTTSRPDPKLLVVAPMSGHFSALLRDLLAALLPDHDVHLVHWRDARDVPTTDGPFGLEDYIADLMDCIRAVDGDLHVMGVCQSAIPVIAATALLAADKMPVEPASMILFNGMIDPRIRPSRVARLSAAQASAWFMRACMSTVPAPHAGAGRLVYPAILRHQALLGHLARRRRRPVTTSLRRTVSVGNGSAGAIRPRHDPLYLPGGGVGERHSDLAGYRGRPLGDPSHRVADHRRRP